MSRPLPDSVLAQLVDASLDAALIVDANCVIRYVNGALEHLVGYGAGELLGQPMDGLLPDATANVHSAYVRHYITGNAPSTVLGKVREFSIRHRNGETIPIELKAIDLGTENGVRYLGAFMEDLRPRRLLEQRQHELLRQLERLALSDTLTGLPNRRAFDQQADQAQLRARRSHTPITIGIADIDHFKRVNDDYGHPVGDLALQMLARIIREQARATDVVARTGGEEFGLLFPDATPEQALLVAERIRLAVGATPVCPAGGTPFQITISIGLAALPAGATVDAAMAAADAALYEAKRGGRNCVRVATRPL